MKIQELPLNIRVATPCSANWDDMRGDDRARFCGQCSKHVYNLSALSATAAAELIREKEGHLCGRFFQRQDGTILHGEDCPVGLAAREWRRVKTLVGAAFSLILMTFGVSRTQAATTTASGPKPAPYANIPPKPAPIVIMGDICVPTPTPKPTPAPTPTPPAGKP